MDAGLLKKYNQLLYMPYPPTYEDIEQAEDSIGADGAILLNKVFNITRFGRYHATMLSHLVKMASVKDYKKDKPLILTLVAKDDPTGWFYWGNSFEYDDDVRVAVYEVDSREVFIAALKLAKKNFGIPDVLFIVAHGAWSGISLGNPTESFNCGLSTLMDSGGINLWDGPYLMGQLQDIYEDYDVQIVIDACSAADDLPDEVAKIKYFQKFKNVAQMFANVFNTNAYAPAGVEGLLSLSVYFEDGYARLDPLFFELPFFFNGGGYEFEPDTDLNLEEFGPLINGGTLQFFKD